MVNVSDGPVHGVPPFVNVGVTFIVATTGAPVVLDAINVEILPVPEAANPILVSEFVQL